MVNFDILEDISDAALQEGPLEDADDGFRTFSNEEVEDLCNYTKSSMTDICKAALDRLSCIVSNQPEKYPIVVNYLKHILILVRSPSLMNSVLSLVLSLYKADSSTNKIISDSSFVFAENCLDLYTVSNRPELLVMLDVLFTERIPLQPNKALIETLLNFVDMPADVKVSCKPNYVCLMLSLLSKVIPAWTVAEECFVDQRIDTFVDLLNEFAKDRSAPLTLYDATLGFFNMIAVHLNRSAVCPYVMEKISNFFSDGMPDSFLKRNSSLFLLSNIAALVDLWDNQLFRRILNGISTYPIISQELVFIFFANTSIRSQFEHRHESLFGEMFECFLQYIPSSRSPNCFSVLVMFIQRLIEFDPDYIECMNIDLIVEALESMHNNELSPMTSEAVQNITDFLFG